MLCPCHSHLPYNRCCKSYHDKKTRAPNALALMRSRYSAYALHLTDYIIDTTDPEGPQYTLPLDVWKKEILVFSQSYLFTGLTILSFNEDGLEATVSFSAEITQGEHVGYINEESLFYYKEGRWLYHSCINTIS